jgi:SAM-dependent methyltransferase
VHDALEIDGRRPRVKDVGEDAPRYVLGHSAEELERLSAQARLVEPITRGFLRDAGIGSGMRVLDVGSGAGDVAFLVADLVGASGEVVGVDRSPDAVSAATARAATRSLGNVSFLEGDPAEMVFEQHFDAVIGRYVLQFQDDPAAMLRKVAGHVRPGGTIFFHELDWGGVRSIPAAPTFDAACRWMSETILLSGAEIHMGTKLHSTFIAAGLPAPTMRLEALLGGGEHMSGRLQLFADLARTLLPAAERLGVGPASDVDLEALLEQMSDEVRANGSLVVAHFQVAAWSLL